MKPKVVYKDNTSDFNPNYYADVQGDSILFDHDKLDNKQCALKLDRVECDKVRVRRLINQLITIEKGMDF